jgi:hypothetical protein
VAGGGGGGDDGGGGGAEEDSVLEDGMARSKTGGVISGGFLLMRKISVLGRRERQLRLIFP